MIHRPRAMAIEDGLDDRGLDLALAARRAEADDAASHDGGRLMEDAGFILGSYVLTFAAVGAARRGGAARRAAGSPSIPDDAKYWT